LNIINEFIFDDKINLEFRRMYDMRVIKKNVNLKKVKLENVKLIYLGGKL